MRRSFAAIVLTVSLAAAVAASSAPALAVIICSGGPGGCTGSDAPLETSAANTATSTSTMATTLSGMAGVQNSQYLIQQYEHALFGGGGSWLSFQQQIGAFMGAESPSDPYTQVGAISAGSVNFSPAFQSLFPGYISNGSSIGNELQEQVATRLEGASQAYLAAQIQAQQAQASASQVQSLQAQSDSSVGTDNLLQTQSQTDIDILQQERLNGLSETMALQNEAAEAAAQAQAQADAQTYADQYVTSETAADAKLVQQSPF